MHNRKIIKTILNYASKNYIISLTRAINKELRKNKSKVKMSLLCPGPVNTNFNNVANVKFNIIVKILSKISPISIVEEIAYHIQEKKRNKNL